MRSRRKRRKPAKKKRSWWARFDRSFSKPDLKKCLSVIFLVFFFLFSILAAGYVIFFRTVFAQEVLKTKRDTIVFEEPFAPVAAEVIKKIAVVGTKLPRIAIIIDDMGYDEGLGRRLLSLNMNLCFSFLPFAPFTLELDEIAYKSGKTILLHLPMEPTDSEWDPGPGALFLDKEPDQLEELFQKNLDSVPHATGVNNHMGSLYTENKQAMTKLLAVIKEKELFYVDSVTSAKSVGMSLAVSAGVKTARRHVFLDNVLDEEQVCKQLEKLVETAEHHGYGIGIGHPNQVTFTALSKCMKTLSARFKLVSVTELLH